MQNIKKFNLELALFAKELHSYTENVNEIDDETTQLLSETILGLSKLQIGSKYRETPITNVNQFVTNLNNEIFKCRRYIVCRLCQEQFPLNSEDFAIHNQKQCHKANVEKLTPKNQKNDNDATEATRNSLFDTKNNENFNVDHVDQKISHNNNYIETVDESKQEENALSMDIEAKSDDALKVELLHNTIITKMIELTMRTTERIQNEKQISNILNQRLKNFDSNLKIMQFGSASYGFGGSVNLNFLVHAGNSEKYPMLIQHEFWKLMLTGQDDFEVLNNLSGSRSQKQRIQLLHKQSKILCWLQFGYDFELAKTSQILRDCIQYMPICYYLTAYIKAWQEVIIGATNSESDILHFNSYIIMVLVIFYLQVNHQFPPFEFLPKSQCKSIKTVARCNKDQLTRMIFEFFDFYAMKYNFDHLLSPMIGQFQDRQLLAQNMFLTLQQKSLKNAIDSNYVNWKDCVMLVQDIQSPGVNITAEISAGVAQNFKKMCNAFLTNELHKFFLDEYIAKLPQLRLPESVIGSNLSLNSIASIKSNVSKSSAESSSVRNASSAGSVLDDWDETTMKCILSYIRGETTNEDIIDKSQILFRNLNITSILGEFIEKFNENFKIESIGSTQYGISHAEANLNLFIHTDARNLGAVFRGLFKHLSSSDIQTHFEDISEINGNRVLRQQICMTHIDSGLKCLILLDNEKSAIDSSEVITRFIERIPMCSSLIKFIRTWQNVLRRMNSDNDVIKFHFNTYMISILVIFFFQVNYNVPVVDHIWSIPPKNASDHDVDLIKLIQEFFSFYGNDYKIYNQVVSTHVGQWLERFMPVGHMLSATQQRFQNEIDKNPASWRNCTMYVQDIIRTDLNIAAEVPRKAVENFKQICQMFAKNMPNYK